MAIFFVYALLIYAYFFQGYAYGVKQGLVLLLGVGVYSHLPD